MNVKNRLPRTHKEALERQARVDTAILKSFETLNKMEAINTIAILPPVKNIEPLRDGRVKLTMAIHRPPSVPTQLYFGMHPGSEFKMAYGCVTHVICSEQDILGLLTTREERDKFRMLLNHKKESLGGGKEKCLQKIFSCLSFLYL